ncbi:hypothetical protein [Streptomyces sp. NPDC015350]|uniref:hypothetical protein n=1 Tax=Streptomyces sp. NPDC015350 TaxID=3364955 RepID=UPI0036F4E6BB
MIRDFPPLPLPQYAVVRIGCAPGVSAEIAADLREVGVPAGLIGYQYQPLAGAMLLDGIGESGLVVFGSGGLFGRLGVDVASRRVVQISKIGSGTAWHVNRDLGAFHWCVAGIASRFPF